MSLENEIDSLEQLDTVRNRCRTWRNEARTALESFIEGEKQTGIHWLMKVDLRDRVLFTKALSYPDAPPKLLAGLVDEIQKVPAEEIIGVGAASPLFDDESDTIRYFDAARGLTALTSAPKGAFRRTTMYFYYVVLRELYYAAAPEWNVGGARSAPGGPPTAYTTAQFVRGILSFARTLQRTADYASALAEMSPAPANLPEAWRTIDEKRRRTALQTTLALRSWNLALQIDGDPVPVHYDANALATFENELPTKIIESLDRAVEEFEAALAVVTKFREEEIKAATTLVRRRVIGFSEAAHAMAAGALEDAVQRAKEARKLFPNGTTRPITNDWPTFATNLRELSKLFQGAEKTVTRAISPAVNYLSTILDRELASTAFEPAEMATAAASYGFARKGWQDERLELAARRLTEILTDRGFPTSKPYHTSSSTYYLPAQPVMLTAYAQLLQHVATVEVPVTAARRLAAYFNDTRREISDRAASWKWVHGRTTDHSAPNTAAAAIALDHITRMLDTRINAAVLRNFEHRHLDKPKLHELFYADYGLAAEKARTSVAVWLERMRAHIAGLHEHGVEGDPLYAVVLHGPPGTSKTTLIEALAATAGVPLVEVTPSDIVVRGTEAIEERARAVLRSLSLLTNAVILFDEFDPVLRSRTSGDAETSMFTFLTAGMLPKLKRLYDSAAERHIAYALVTNFRNELDGAAIRGGRFDEQIGIYPPDLLSRYGRLHQEVQAHLGNQELT
ncbi:MAG: ATPase central protein, partial [Acidobacteria bacterium]|nr:ATPase central protein [Acidobacteriota bacterium]